MKLSDLVEVRDLAAKRVILQKVCRQKLERVTFSVAQQQLTFESDAALEKFQDIVQEELDAVEEELEGYGVELDEKKKVSQSLSSVKVP